MLARRVIAISPDKAIAKRLGAGLMAAGGSAEVVPSIEALSKGDIQAALVVVHLPSEDVSVLDEVERRLKKDAWILVVIADSNLKILVAAMQKSSRIAGCLVADELDTKRLAAMATRVMYGDIFGLEKVVPWGTRVYSTLVGDYQEKSICISQISDYAASMGVRRKYREAIEQVADELLMNALYDAPVDQSGNQLFADVPTKTRISLRMEQKAVVQYACDADTFTISVRDSFGTLDRDTVVKYLHKCLYAEQQIDRKAGGAGLGLYIMANATTQLLFNTLPGVATEVVCSFDLRAPKVQIKEFGFFNEKIDASGRLVAGRSQLHPRASGASGGFPVERRQDAPAASRGVIAALTGAIVLLLALIGLVAYPRFVQAPRADIAVVTDPPNTQIEIDGRIRGTTGDDGRLIVEDLEVGRVYRVTASRQGWGSTDAVIEPRKGDTATIDLRLAAQDAKVYLDSDPAGATVVYDGRQLGTTPLTTTELPPNEEIELVFRKDGYRETQRTLRMPRPGGEATIATTLPISADFGTVSINSEPSGAKIYQNDELLAGVTTPVTDHLIQADKKYSFRLVLPGHTPAVLTTQVKAGERAAPLQAKLVPGGAVTVTSNIDGRVTVRGVKACTRVSLPMRDCPVPNGKYRLSIDSNRPFADHAMPIAVKGDDVEVDVQFGFVEATEGHALKVRRRDVDKMALPEGTHTVTLANQETGETQKVQVKIQPGKTVTLP